MTRPRGATDEQIAAMLRDGATHQQIKTTLRVGGDSITRARTTQNVPYVPRTGDDLRAHLTRRYPQAIAMLRAGATRQTITATTRISTATLTKIRKAFDLPAPKRPRPTSTIPQVLARHLQPYGDGHARWTGPQTGTKPELNAGGRRYSARRQAFAAHHGRTPEGRVTATCTEPRCIAGAHLADDIIRTQQQAEQQLDATYGAIFGPDAP
ncbi:hypothetical protein [Streptomyces antibioticus]|uniref:hypothetical protein n=1 Tax=Streptomyces antibioticus TaxID=1890 RepID=UPI003D741324